MDAFDARLDSRDEGADKIRQQESHLIKRGDRR